MILELDGLRTHFFTRDGVVRAVDGVSFALSEGETLGVVGESGCGKSVAALSILRLVAPPGRIVGGAIRFEGENLLERSEAGMRALRGNRISMIFQEPMTSLNPVLTVGHQIAEALRRFQMEWLAIEVVLSGSIFRTRHPLLRDVVTAGDLRHREEARVGSGQVPLGHGRPLRDRGSSPWGCRLRLRLRPGRRPPWW